MFLKTLVLVGALAPALGRADAVKAALVSPAVLHALAKSTTLPIYPSPSSNAKHAGVAVIEVVVSPAGKVIKAEVLEAPDTAIANAVETAVKQWNFYPFTAGGTPLAMRSRLIFYFRFIQGKPLVIDALTRNSAFRERAQRIGPWHKFDSHAIHRPKWGEA